MSTNVAFSTNKKQDSTTVGLKKKRSHGWIINETNDTEKSVQKSFRYFTEDFLLKFEIFFTILYVLRQAYAKPYVAC